MFDDLFVICVSKCLFMLILLLVRGMRKALAPLQLALSFEFLVGQLKYENTHQYLLEGALPDLPFKSQHDLWHFVKLL